MIVVTIKKQSVNKNVVPTIIHNECKELLWNNKCSGYLMNRIQRKNHKIGSYKINKISLSCFDDKIYSLNNGYDGLTLGY